MTINVAGTLGRQERDDLEFKRDLGGRDQLRKAVCALSNDLPGRGVGHLIIGVDKVGAPVGLAASDDELLQAVALRNEARILPPPVIKVERAVFDDVPCICVTVFASPSPPVALDGQVWVRVGPSTRRATRDEERLLSERRRAADLPFDERPVTGSTIADLDLELFRSTYLPAAVAPEVLVENGRSLDDQLAALRLCDPITSAPTVVGQLVLGLDPGAWLPGAYLQFVRYEGVDESSAVVDHEELRGNMVAQLDSLGRLIAANVRTAVVAIDPLRQQDRPDYPIAALRECVLNAVAHRNYESSNAPVRLLWFSDRVEVSSPGGPFGSVTANNFRQRNDYRNPSVAAALKNLGYVNRFGRGIALIDGALARNGNPPPEYQIENEWWGVVIRAAV